MRDLKLKEGSYYDHDTETYNNVAWFELGDTIYDNVMFLLDESCYENTIEDPSELTEDWTMHLGKFTNDETNEIIHQIVCDDALNNGKAAITESIKKALKTWSDYQKRINS